MFFRKLFLVQCLLVLINSLSAQVINVESKRFLNDTNGWVGKIDFDFLLTQNTQQIMQIGNNVHVQYQHNKHRFLILNDVKFVKAGSTDFVNSGYQHLRYNYKIVPRITWEGFLQAQYNKVLKLQARYLAGTGPRFKLIKNGNVKLYIAALYMFEDEYDVGVPQPFYANRISSYLTFSIGLSKNADLTSTTFYQPNLANFADHRIANDTALEIYVSKRLNFKAGLNLLYDTYQPEGIPSLVYSVRNGLSFKF